MSKIKNLTKSTPEELIAIINEQSETINSQTETISDLNREIELALEVNSDLQRKIEFTGTGEYKGFPKVKVKKTFTKDGKSVTKEVEVYVTQRNLFIASRNGKVKAADVISDPELLNKLVSEGHGAFLSEEDYQEQTKALQTRLKNNYTLEQNLGLVTK